jgi:catechol 2,3-dioxygenase-like lactoylglutathione lyase family enzyme
MRARIHITSVFVDDQAKALAFYTEKLGFMPKSDFPAGEHRWLTVVSADDPDGIELLLEPDDHPASKAFKAAIAEDGIPATSFIVDDVEAAHKELEQLGVTFVQPPTAMGPSMTAILDDTCGNLIMIASGEMAA